MTEKFQWGNLPCKNHFDNGVKSGPKVLFIWKKGLMFFLKQSKKVSDKTPEIQQDVGDYSTVICPVGVAPPSFMLGNCLT